VNLATLIGLGLGVIGILLGYMMEGGQPASLINIPALIIVACGTMAGAFVSFGLPQMLGLPKLFLRTILTTAPHAEHIVPQFVTMADKARREGLLSLESDASAQSDAFMKKGLMLMIDGTDPELLREILEIDIEALEHRHEENFKVFEALGGFAPTAGIIGTVMGLITVLSNLANPAELGHKIAGAFIATFYGIFSANIFFLPMGAKLKGMSREEVYVRRMTMEGILAIQAGDNPRVVQEKLESYLSPKARGKKATSESAEQERAAA